MRLLVSIASYQRPQKLLRLLKSLSEQTYFNFETLVVFDNEDDQSLKEVKSLIDFPFTYHVMRQHEYVIGCWNTSHRICMNLGYDANLTLCDDIKLYSDCIEKAVNHLINKFSDLDGVIGISQNCEKSVKYNYNPAGQVLIGSKFIDRYNSVYYNVCCTNYIQWFQDAELFEYASSANKFDVCKEAIVTHYHPVHHREEMDETHSMVRGNIYQRDKNIYRNRKQLGLVWGKSWEEI
jgi:glycosyltransferase involved in cell wall biosynthesis